MYDKHNKMKALLAIGIIHAILLKPLILDDMPES